MQGDPVRVTAMWQGTCDDCGWHTPPSEPESAVREWARLHRVTCPLKGAVRASIATDAIGTDPDSVTLSIGPM